MFSLPVKNSNEEYVINPSKIIAMGLNYKSHIFETAMSGIRGFTSEIPNEPVIFPKTPNTLIPHQGCIVIPKFIYNCGFKNVRVDYEAELAFIINQRCKNVKKENAYDYIYGFMCANDVSQRNIQNHDKSGWFRGKSLDTFCPVGPHIVKTADIGDPQNLKIECRLNGTTVQSTSTNQMLFTIPEIVEYITMNFTLEAGDIILTGTPEGVGAIKPGDKIEVEIENIGILESGVVSE